MWLNVNDVKQYLYCKRIIYYTQFLGIIPTYMMIRGKEIENKITDAFIKETTESLSKNVKIEKSVALKCNKLKLFGIIDFLLKDGRLVVPIEVKYGSYNDNHLYQLYAYSILVENYFNTNVDFGFILYIDEHNTYTNRIKITLENKRKIIKLISEIKSTLDIGIRPIPTENVRKCIHCEFNKFCDDVF